MTQEIKTLNPIDLIGRISSNMIKYILLSIFFWIFVNRWFVIFYFWRIWNAEWLGGWFIGHTISVIIFIVFIVIFPFIYLRNMRLMAVTSTVQVIRDTYRQEVVTFVIDRVCKSTYMNNIQKWQKTWWTRKQRFSDLPVLVRRFFSRIKNKIPMFENLEKVLQEIDLTKVCDEKQLHLELNKKMQPYIDDKKPLNIGWWFRRLVWINIVCIIITIVLVSL